MIVDFLEILYSFQLTPEEERILDEIIAERVAKAEAERQRQRAEQLELLKQSADSADTDREPHPRNAP